MFRKGRFQKEAAALVLHATLLTPSFEGLGKLEPTVGEGSTCASAYVPTLIDPVQTRKFEDMVSRYQMDPVKLAEFLNYLHRETGVSSDWVVQNLIGDRDFKDAFKRFEDGRPQAIVVISMKSQQASVLFEKPGGAPSEKYTIDVSTGTEEGKRATPKQGYSVKMKDVDHKSSKYPEPNGGAPMPFYHQLSDGGAGQAFGMHQGIIASKNASHGCIRIGNSAVASWFWKRTTPYFREYVSEYSVQKETQNPAAYRGVRINEYPFLYRYDKKADKIVIVKNPDGTPRPDYQVDRGMFVIIADDFRPDHVRAPYPDPSWTREEMYGKSRDQGSVQRAPAVVQPPSPQRFSPPPAPQRKGFFRGLFGN